MSGAHRLMHSQRHAGPAKALQAICKRSVMALKTPLPDAGNKLVLNRKPLQSANEVLKMPEVASWFSI
jgi:hypothetical protein